MHTDARKWRVKIDTKVCSRVQVSSNWRDLQYFKIIDKGNLGSPSKTKLSCRCKNGFGFLFMESDLIAVFPPRARPGFESDLPFCFLNRLVDVAENGLLSEWMKQHLTNVQNFGVVDVLVSFSFCFWFFLSLFFRFLSSTLICLTRYALPHGLNMIWLKKRRKITDSLKRSESRIPRLTLSYLHSNLCFDASNHKIRQPRCLEVGTVNTI